MHGTRDSTILDVSCQLVYFPASASASSSFSICCSSLFCRTFLLHFSSNYFEYHQQQQQARTATVSLSLYPLCLSGCPSVKRTVNVCACQGFQPISSRILYWFKSVPSLSLPLARLPAHGNCPGCCWSRVWSWNCHCWSCSWSSLHYGCRRRLDLKVAARRRRRCRCSLCCCCCCWRQLATSWCDLSVPCRIPFGFLSRVLCPLGQAFCNGFRAINGWIL